MGFSRRLKLLARGMVAPTLFLSLVGYFGWNATQGERGLQSYALRQTQLKLALDDLHRVEADRDTLDRRVAGLRNQRLDLDTLEERSRLILNAGEPTDLVMTYDSGKRLF